MKCIPCTVAGPCQADQLGGGRLCELYAIRPDYRALIHRLSGDPIDDCPPPASAPRLHPAARLVIRCPDRTREGCGCDGTSRCGRSGGLVTFSQCLECKAGEVTASSGCPATSTR